jgi:restriction endonuclease S subunit
MFDLQEPKTVINNKAEWKTVRLIDVCDIDPSKRELNGIDKDTEVSFGMMADLGEHTRKFEPKDKKKIVETVKGGYSYFKEKDVLLAKMTPCFENGKSGIALNLLNGIGFGSTEFYVLRPNHAITSDWLYYIVSSDKFLNEGKYSLVGTTGRRRLLKQFVENFEVPLPSITEQESITSLLNLAEASFTHLSNQEVQLRKLCRTLVNDFVSEKPVFGSLLIEQQLKSYSYKEIAQKLLRKIDPVNYGITRIVAGENLETEDFNIRSWGTVGKDFLGPAFHILFKPGDILYGSRRTYLKKVALADFEGVCANTTFVIKANEKIILQDLLKHIMLSDRFTHYSIGMSKGSTNPYINWKDLDSFNLLLPELEIQQKIVEILDGILLLAEECRQQCKTLSAFQNKLIDEILK